MGCCAPHFGRRRASWLACVLREKHSRGYKQPYNPRFYLDWSQSGNKNFDPPYCLADFPRAIFQSVYMPFEWNELQPPPSPLHPLPPPQALWAIIGVCKRKQYDAWNVILISPPWMRTKRRGRCASIMVIECSPSCAIFPVCTTKSGKGHAWGFE